VLAEQFSFQLGAGDRVEGPGQAQIGGLVAGQLPGEHPADPGVLGDGGDLVCDLVAGSAGAAAGQGGGQVVQGAGGLGQGGGLESGHLGGVQFG
jgi:hypothetical protein